MNKIETIRTISAKSGIPQATVDNVLEAIADVVTETLANDKTEKIPLPGLGAFKTKFVSERRGTSHLGANKEWVKPAHDEICFRVSGTIKEL